MKLRSKILLTIILAVAYVYVVQPFFERPARKMETIYQVRPYDLDMVETWFKSYNEKYFGNRLPRTTMFVWQDSHNAKFEDRTLGTTQCNVSGTVCVITLDSYYNKANVTAQLSLLHELCHADTTGKNLDPHGPAWQACMSRLYTAHAMEGLL